MSRELICCFGGSGGSGSQNAARMQPQCFHWNAAAIVERDDAGRDDAGRDDAERDDAERDDAHQRGSTVQSAALQLIGCCFRGL